MPRRQQPDSAVLAPELVRELESTLRALQEKIAAHSSPGHQFALIHLVKGLSLEQWKEVADQHQVQQWLALPLDRDEGVPLTQLQRTLEELVYQRDHDMLTGLANRRLFNRQIALEMQRAQRTGSPLSLVMIDLDNFKHVNDAHGHLAGDEVLVALGEMLKGSLRVYDLAARVGGEEFCLLLPGASTRQAADLAERILDDFRQIAFAKPGGGSFHITFSAGVATAHAGPTPATPDALYAEADALMYSAKDRGRNCIETMTAKYRVSENPTLVQASEKQFLFTGKFIQ